MTLPCWLTQLWTSVKPPLSSLSTLKLSRLALFRFFLSFFFLWFLPLGHQLCLIWLQCVSIFLQRGAVLIWVTVKYVYLYDKSRRINETLFATKLRFKHCFFMDGLYVGCDGLYVGCENKLSTLMMKGDIALLFHFILFDHSFFKEERKISSNAARLVFTH